MFRCIFSKQLTPVCVILGKLCVSKYKPFHQLFIIVTSGLCSLDVTVTKGIMQEKGASFLADGSLIM